ncbi:MAG: hypothetical protein KC561_13730, partial [Myxococcales bacterium]|nr:hypothetical protein [Myxococcales bacterium]
RTYLIDSRTDRWPGHNLHLTTPEAQRAGAFFNLEIPGEGWRNAVLRAPLEAAGFACSGSYPTRERLRELLELRSFEPTWYDQMHAIALEWLVSAPMQNS